MPLPDAQAKPRAGVKLKPLGLKSVVDRGPVTEEEIERTHDRIRSHMKSRASTFRQVCVAAMQPSFQSCNANLCAPLMCMFAELQAV